MKQQPRRKATQIMNAIAKCYCARHLDGSVTTSMCPAHAKQDPCLRISQITGKRRKGSIKKGHCTNCGHTEQNYR